MNTKRITTIQLQQRNQRASLPPRNPFGLVAFSSSSPGVLAPPTLAPSSEGKTAGRQFFIAADIGASISGILLRSLTLALYTLCSSLTSAVLQLISLQVFLGAPKNCT